MACHQNEHRANLGFNGLLNGLIEGISFIKMKGVDETRVLIKHESGLLKGRFGRKLEA